MQFETVPAQLLKLTLTSLLFFTKTSGAKQSAIQILGHFLMSNGAVMMSNAMGGLCGHVSLVRPMVGSIGQELVKHWSGRAN